MAEAITCPEVNLQLKNQWLHSLTGLANLQSVGASSSKCDWVSQASASKSVEPVWAGQSSRCEQVSQASVSRSVGPVWAGQSSQCEWVSWTSVSGSVESVWAGQSSQCERVSLASVSGSVEQVQASQSSKCEQVWESVKQVWVALCTVFGITVVHLLQMIWVFCGTLALGQAVSFV